MARETNGSGSAGKNLRITHVRMEQWKNFGAVDVDLQRRVFVVGPNAAGKSNFLDAFRFLRDLAAVGGGLAASVAQRGGMKAIRALAARAASDVTLEVTLGTDQLPNAWRYAISMHQDKKGRPLVRTEQVWQGQKSVLKRPDSDDIADPERLTQTYLEQVNVNRAFRDVADFLESIRYLHLVPQLVRDPVRSAGLRNDPFGGDFLAQIAEARRQTRDARLKRISQALKVAVPRLKELELHRDDRGEWHLRGRYDNWRAKGAWQYESQFSDGTLRLMGLLWSLLDGKGPLLLEEPELSLHAGVVRFLPPMFSRMQARSGRQLFVSSHSPELFMDRGIGLDEVLILDPSGESTGVSLASGISEVQALLHSGASLADAIMPRTTPKNAAQLTLFGKT